MTKRPREPINVAVCMPANDMMHTVTAQSFMSLVARHVAIDDRVAFTRKGGTILQSLRNEMMKEACETGSDWIFMADSDMEFPAWTIERLIQWDQPVVAANCSRRMRPISPTARLKNSWLSRQSEILWPEPSDDPIKQGLVEVESVGFAVALIKAEVFLEVPYPWFDTPFIHEIDKHCGEDVFFCGQLQQKGIPIYVDQGLSWHVYHHGTYGYGMGDTLVERDHQVAAGYGPQ